MAQRGRRRYNALPMKALRSISPTALLVGLGLLTTAIYATLIWLYPLTAAAGATKPFDFEKLSRGREWAAGFYVVGILAAFATLAAAFFVVQRARRPVLTVAGFGLLNALLLVGLYPITAIDIFYYVLQGRQEVLYHLNPLAVAAVKIGSDPLLAFVGEWKNIPSPYGPIWGVMSAGVVRLGFAGTFDGVLAFKLVALAAFAACIAVLLWGAGRNAQALLLFAWNPLVLLQGPGNGHNDLLMITVAALALVLWDRRRWWAASVVVLALAAAVKAPALLLAPLLGLDIVRRQAGWGRRA